MHRKQEGEKDIEREEKNGTISDGELKKRGRRRRRRRIIFWGLLMIPVLIFGIRYLLSDQLEVTFHHLYSRKMACGETVRVVVLSDLHNREFGPGNEDLAAVIASLKPDLIAVVGDMVNGDDENLDVILTLCDKLVEIAPVYYSPGNHENNLLYEKGSPLENLLLEKGVHVLVNRAEAVTIRKTPFLIGSLTTAPDGYEEYGAVFFDEYEKSRDFKLLLAHYPSLYYEALADGDIDLGICGHYHGGQVRLPFMGGLYHGDTGFFPKYNGGMYVLPNSTIFVSRGLGGHSGLPRINNRPELAVIDINGRQETEIP